MRLSIKICLIVLAAYFAAAVYGEVQYRVALARDVTPAYNVVNTKERYQPPSAEHWLGLGSWPVGIRVVRALWVDYPVGVLFGEGVEAVGTGRFEEGQGGRVELLVGGAVA
jgi:hypothetical protein